MDDSPSTVCTIEEEKLDIRPNDHLYTSNLYTDNFISLPPPPPVFGNRQNSIQSNNSKDNEIYSIFSNPNTSYNSINESVESFDQIYHHDYDINQSLDSIPDSLIDNTTIGSNLNITSNTTQSSHLYQVNQNFDSHNQNHNQNQNFLHGTASESNFQFFNSYDNVPDNLDFYHPDASPTTNSISHSPSFTGSHIDYNLSFHNNPAGNHPEVNNRFGVHKFHSEMNLSVNTKISSYNRYGSLSSLSNPSSAISASAIPPNSASSSIPTSASTSTPIKLENGNYLQLATFRHNPQTYLPALHHQNHSPAHMANNLTNQHQHTILHPSNPYVSPRRKPHSDHDDSNTPTTTTTNSISNPNSRSNSISNSPLNSSITSMNSFNIPTMQNIPNLQNQAMAEKAKKHTRRRLLPRSKNGCWICRIKHLKCDEVRPTCSSCEKFGIHCDYSPEKPLYVSDKNLRTEKLLEITLIRKSNQRLKSKVSRKRLKDTNS